MFIENLVSWYFTNFSLFFTTGIGELQLVLVRYVRFSVVICVNQNKLDMKKKDKTSQLSKPFTYDDIDEMYASLDRKYQLNVPSNFRMLCAILDVKVQDILADFMWLVSYSVHRDADGKRRDAAREFFMSCQYGQPHYSEEKINQMFEELKAERLIYDTINCMDHEDLQVFHRYKNMHMQHWFKRWFNKIDRAKGDISILNEY